MAVVMDGVASRPVALPAPQPGRVDVDELLCRPFAHRGLHDATAPENSLPAFAQALDRRLGIELDVRLSADGVPVVHHDATLGRMCGVARRVSDVAMADLARLRLARTDAAPPTLAAALHLIGGAVPVLVDVKAGASMSERRCLVDAVSIIVRAYRGPVGVVGFDPWLLSGVASRAPRVARGQSAGVAPSVVASGWWMRAACHPIDAFWSIRLSKPHFLTFNVERLPSDAVARARGVRPVVAWTVRTAEDYAAALRCADGVIVEGAAVDFALASARAAR